MRVIFGNILGFGAVVGKADAYTSIEFIGGIVVGNARSDSKKREPVIR